MPEKHTLCHFKCIYCQNNCTDVPKRPNLRIFYHSTAVITSIIFAHLCLSVLVLSALVSEPASDYNFSAVNKLSCNLRSGMERCKGFFICRPLLEDEVFRLEVGGLAVLLI